MSSCTTSLCWSVWFNIVELSSLKEKEMTASFVHPSARPSWWNWLDSDDDEINIDDVEFLIEKCGKEKGNEWRKEGRKRNAASQKSKVENGSKSNFSRHFSLTFDRNDMIVVGATDWNSSFICILVTHESEVCLVNRLFSFLLFSLFALTDCPAAAATAGLVIWIAASANRSAHQRPQFYNCFVFFGSFSFAFFSFVCSSFLIMNSSERSFSFFKNVLAMCLSTRRVESK